MRLHGKLDLFLKILWGFVVSTEAMTAGRLTQLSDLEEMELLNANYTSAIGKSLF